MAAVTGRFAHPHPAPLPGGPPSAPDPPGAPALAVYRFLLGARTLEVRAASSLEPLLAEADPDRIPFWAMLWPSAPALARHLADGALGAGRRVLELGCGVGLSGIAAAALGARVTQTDRFPEAVLAARGNARRNGVRGLRCAAADWRAWPFISRWPLIVGSDILYERSAHGALRGVLERSLEPGGTVLLTDPCRPMSLAFLVAMERSGWSVDLQELPRDETGEVVWLISLRRDP